MRLASSPWPRTGADERNSATSGFGGPTSATFAGRATLGQRGKHAHSAVVIAEDGSLRVTFGPTLSAWTADLELMWEIGYEVRSLSAPVCLGDNQALVAEGLAFAVVDRDGATIARLPVPSPHDDSGPSPCVTRDGLVVVSTINGEVYRRSDDDWVELGNFGYDILPPAMFTDGSLAIAGYAGTGLVRVERDGATRWTGANDQVDGLCVIDGDDRAAIKSLNNGTTEIYDGGGRLLTVYPRAAIASVHPDGFVMLSTGRVALVDTSGVERWGRALAVEIDWGLTQCAIDAAGRIYAPFAEGVTCFDRDGALVFATALPEGRPGSIAIAGPGRLVFTHGDQLAALQS